MSVEVHLDWEGTTHRVGVVQSAPRGSAVTFEYSTEWFARPGSIAIDPTSLPLRPGPHHGTTLFGAIRDCGPDRWGRVLIERAVRRQALESKPYRDLDYVLALGDSSRIGALRFCVGIDAGKIGDFRQVAAVAGEGQVIESCLAPMFLRHDVVDVERAIGVPGRQTAVLCMNDGLTTKCTKVTKQVRTPA